MRRYGNTDCGMNGSLMANLYHAGMLGWDNILFWIHYSLCTRIACCFLVWTG